MSFPSHGLPNIKALPTLPVEGQATVLNLLFEPSPPLQHLVLPSLASKSFTSYGELISHVDGILITLASSSSPEDRTVLHSILGSHPRLGAPKVDSAQSASEQSQLQGQGEEAALLADLNAEYESKFPGLRYVVFVNGRGRPEIMADMKTRIARGNQSLEEQAAIQAMCDIANDRASKLQQTA